MDYIVESMKPEHWPQVRAIYNQGLATGLAAFSTKAPRWDEWDTDHLELGRIIVREEGVTGNAGIVAFGALTEVDST